MTNTMIEQMPKYDSYKKSGVEWSNELPEHWEIKKIFHNFYAKKGDRAAQLTKEYCDLINGEYPVYSGQTGNDGVMGKIDTYEFDMTGEGCLFSTTVGAKAMTLKYLDSKFSLSQNCMVIINRNKTEVNSKFCFYAFQPLFSFYRKQIPEHMQASFRMEDLYQYKYFLPPISEQVAITLFLDKKTAQIDEAIAIKQKQIELLKERKQIIIQQAVTQGLNPDAPMKDSGLDWIGTIPEHWEAIKLKRLFKETTSRTKTGEETLLSLRMERGLVPHDEVSDKPIPAENLIDYKLVEPGQMVMNRMRAAIGIFGIPYQSGLVSPDYAVFNVSQEIVAEFYLLLFKTQIMGTQFRLASKGMGTGSSGFMRLYTENFGNIKVPLGPLVEQKEILEKIEKESSKLNRAIDNLNLSIDKLKEYKTTLINSAVTGKIKVTGLA